MNVNEIINNRIKKLSDEITMASDNIASKKLKKANYDKTLIGFVSEKIIPENPVDDNDFRWRIQTNGVAYDIKPSNGNITCVGQRVRLYVPSHNLKEKYVEVIDDIFCSENCIRIKRVSDNEVYAIYRNPIDPSICYKQTYTADGSGDERYNFKETIEEIRSDSV